jgi:hypothetical protein
MSPKFRKYLILAHLWLAGLMAPAFALHAISGGLYLMNIKGTAATERVALPTGAELDFESATLEEDVRALLKTANLNHEFEYIRNRGTVIQLRPTSETYLEFKQTPQGLSATRVKPDTVRSMMELHKGHGPQIFKSYQKLVAVLLLGVVLGGILVGLMAKAYRRQTVIAVVIGMVVFVLVGFVL